MDAGIPAQEPETILFRPTKKRKVYRQRADADEPSAHELASPAPILSPIPGESESNVATQDIEGISVTMGEILRLRKRKQRLGGVEFRATPMAGDSSALVVTSGHATEDQNHDQESEVGPARRFAKQTGMVGDVDKHMMAFIEDEIARRRQGGQSKTDQTATTSALSQVDPKPQENRQGQRQPATLGKIQEIDLGEEARDRNATMTENARRRAAGEVVEDESAVKKKNQKVRIGPDGKPWRSRKRRGSDAVMRDSIVDQVLRENRIDLYEEPVQKVDRPMGDGENDDRIAEEFRREFLDAASQRQRKKPAHPPATRGPGGKIEEESRGPKLGGSRSQRLKMQAELAKQKK